MADKLDGFAAADMAALTAAALRIRIAEVDAQVEELRRQASAREAEREFYDAELTKQDAAYEEAVASLVEGGLEEKVVKQVVSVRVQALISSKVEVSLPSPDGRRARVPATRRPRGRTEPAQAGQQAPAAQADGTAQDEGAAERGEVEATRPAAEEQGGGIVLPVTIGAGDEQG